MFGSVRTVAPTIFAIAGMLACTSADPVATSATASESGSESGSVSESESGSVSESESESESGSATESETGEMCTGLTCASTLTLTFEHSLDLLAGPYRFLFDTPTHEISCGVEASLEGAKSCFGFPFSDLSWTETTVTVVLTNPFYATEQNPEGLPFDSITLRVVQGQDLLFEAVVAIDVGEPIEPDPCGPLCWTAVGETTVE